jgi:hypothetical protein
MPRVGKPLSLDLRGPAQGSWVLLLSTETGATVLPFGTLRLAPTALVVAGFGQLDHAGAASITFGVAPLADWVGITLHWQALLGLPLALTNLESTTLTGL